jgi:ATP-binding cassette subfamily C exporter for protease/lipase
LRQSGKTIVLVTHRTTVLGATTKLLLLRDGAVQAFGPRDQVLQAMASAQQQEAAARQQAGATNVSNLPVNTAAPAYPEAKKREA